MFDKRKQDLLHKIDKSRKGDVDKEIAPLVNLINSLEDYYTTSSCAGRIMLIELAKSGKKHESEWLFLKHKSVSFKEIKKSLQYVPKEDVWLRQEGAIIHVCCRNIGDAEKMLNLAREVSFKRSGIITKRRRIIVEIASTEKVDTIIAQKGKVLVGDDYLTILIKEANKRMRKNTKKLKRLYCLVKSLRSNTK
jgi:tRNA wybutosine-synthesizing protein 3